MTGYVDADAAVAPVNSDDEQTAFSDVLDGPAIAAADSNAPTPLATTPTGFAGGSESVPNVTARQGKRPSGPRRSLPNAPSASAAQLLHRRLHGLRIPGPSLRRGLPGVLVGEPKVPLTKHNLHYWYQYHYSILGYHTAATSSTWARAHSLAEFEKTYGGYFYKYEKTQTNVSSNIKPGAVIFAAIAKGSTQFAKIDHTGMVTSVAGNNLYITQHSTNYLSRPLWATHKHRSWFNDSNGLLGAVWVTNPVRRDPRSLSRPRRDGPGPLAPRGARTRSGELMVKRRILAAAGLALLPLAMGAGCAAPSAGAAGSAGASGADGAPSARRCPRRTWPPTWPPTGRGA